MQSEEIPEVCQLKFDTFLCNFMSSLPLPEGQKGGDGDGAFAQKPTI
ncbi:MAG: hypothetical protein QNJ74_05520 [Trichodesmium sp. MO_231.B1]|nr:hypothetical protein [Trichodesmium sp. MO_231.B1]